MKGATFMPVNGSDMKLGDISANDAFEFGGDTLQTLNGNGGTLGLYTYLSKSMLDELNEDPDFAELKLQVGWYDYYDFNNDEFTLCNDVELAYGEMAVIQAGSSDAALVYAGAVAQADAVLNIVAGQWNMRANCMPVDYTLADLTSAAFEFGGDTLQTLNGNGGTLGLYTYLGAETLEELNEDPDFAELKLVVGWYDYYDFNNDEFTLCNDVAIPAGYGFVLQAGSDEAEVTVPSPLAK